MRNKRKKNEKKTLENEKSHNNRSFYFKDLDPEGIDCGELTIFYLYSAAFECRVPESSCLLTSSFG